jgi:hypothetical protein
MSKSKHSKPQEMKQLRQESGRLKTLGADLQKDAAIGGHRIQETRPGVPLRTPHKSDSLRTAA